MGLQCGIVGLPDAGKSTLFDALTKSWAWPTWPPSRRAWPGPKRPRVEGREYVVRDGDVVHFRFNV